MSNVSVNVKLNVCISEKTSLCLFFVIICSDVIQFCQFLAETHPEKFETKHILRAHHTSFYMFTLYLVKLATILQHTVQRQTRSYHIKSPTELFTSDNY